MVGYPLCKTQSRLRSSYPQMKNFKFENLDITGSMSFFLSSTSTIRCSVTAITSRSHRGDRGSTPRFGIYFCHQDTLSIFFSLQYHFQHRRHLSLPSLLLSTTRRTTRRTTRALSDHTPIPGPSCPLNARTSRKLRPVASEQPHRRFLPPGEQKNKSRTRSASLRERAKGAQLLRL